MKFPASRWRCRATRIERTYINLRNHHYRETVRTHSGYHFALPRARKCPFTFVFVNKIGCGGAGIGYEITESDSSGLTSRRWPCFRMPPSLMEGRKQCFSFFTLNFLRLVVRLLMVTTGKCQFEWGLVLVTAKWPLKCIEARLCISELTRRGLLGFRNFRLGSIILCISN